MTNIKRSLKGGSATPVILVSSSDNPVTGAALTIGVLGSALLEGDLFSVTVVDSIVEDGTSLDVLLITGSTKVAMIAGDTDLAFFEDTTISDDGSSESVVNMNRNSAKLSNTFVFQAPTVTGVGTELFNVSFPGGEKKDSTSGSGGTHLGWILKPSSNYLIRITNQSGNAQTISALINIVETEL